MDPTGLKKQLILDSEKTEIIIRHFLDIPIGTPFAFPIHLLLKLVLRHPFAFSIVHPNGKLLGN